MGIYKNIVYFSLQFGTYKCQIALVHNFNKSAIVTADLLRAAQEADVFTTSLIRFILVAKINGISCTIEAVFKDSSPTEGTVFSRKDVSTCIIATYTTFSPPILSQKHIVFVTKCFRYSIINCHKCL